MTVWKGSQLGHSEEEDHRGKDQQRSLLCKVWGIWDVFSILNCVHLIFENSFLLTQSGTKIYWNTKLTVILCPEISWYNWGEWNELYSAKIARRGWLFTGEIAEIADWDFWLRLLRLLIEISDWDCWDCSAKVAIHRSSPPSQQTMRYIYNLSNTVH